MNKTAVGGEKAAAETPQRPAQEKKTRASRGKSVDIINGAKKKAPQNKASTTPTKEGLAKERAKADEVFATSSSRWYAGAAFDRSPAAHTLPRPTQLLARSPSRTTIPVGSTPPKEGTKSRTPSSSPTLLASSCPPFLSRGMEHMERRRRRQQAEEGGNVQREEPEAEAKPSALPMGLEEPEDDLRTKSQALLAMLRAGPQGAIATPKAKAPVASTKELEEMTHQVRRLLNLS